GSRRQRVGPAVGQRGLEGGDVDLDAAVRDEAEPFAAALLNDRVAARRRERLAAVRQRLAQAPARLRLPALRPEQRRAAFARVRGARPRGEHGQERRRLACRKPARAAVAPLDGEAAEEPDTDEHAPSSPNFLPSRCRLPAIDYPSTLPG